MRKNIGKRPLLFPEPVLIIGTYDKSGKANAMNAAWGGLSDTYEICICLSEEHKTVKNILLNKDFTVSVGTKDTVVQCDYVGMTSGNDDTDKLKKCGFHVTKSKKVNAPLIKELPFALECTLIRYDKKTGHLFGEIKDISVDDSILKEGKIDISLLKPIIFNGETNTYHVIGKKVGNAFKDYKKIKTK